MGKRIIIAGGGTGGHIFPAVAIANALKAAEPGIELLFVGAKGKMEMEKIPQAGYKITGIDIAGFNRSSLIKNAGLPIKLFKSFLQVRTIFKQFRPDAAVGVGGYSTYPVLRYAQSIGIPTFIHESNSFAGKSNMLLGKRATKVFAASDGMQQFFAPQKLLMTGNPVREKIATSAITKAQGIRFFGLDEHKKTVLAIGGSLGAKSINEALAAHLGEFENNNLQLIWQTGKTTAAQYKELGTGRKNIWVSDFITEMEYAYAAADVIISRSGSTVYELAVVGKPAILVPYPFAAEDHQTANAQNLVNKDAAILIRDSEVKERLVTTTIALSKDESLQQRLAVNIKKLAITDADNVIAKSILRSIGADKNNNDDYI